MLFFCIIHFWLLLSVGTLACHRLLHLSLHKNLTTIFESLISSAFQSPDLDQWIRKLWYIYTMKYYSAIKKNAFESVLMRWMKLEPVIRSEVRNLKKTNTVYQCIYMECRKRVTTTLYARQQ